MTGPCSSAKTGFFHTIGSMVGNSLNFIFGALLPAVLSFIIVVIVVIVVVIVVFILSVAFWELLKFLARKSGLAAWWEEVARESEEKKEKEREEKGDLGSEAELIDVTDGKKRVEVEIQLLENLLVEKRKELDSLK